MAPFLSYVLPILLLASSVAAAPPSLVAGGPSAEESTAANSKIKSTPNSKKFEVQGVTWQELGLEGGQPQFKTFSVEAVGGGMSAELSVSVDRKHGILVGDNLCRDKKQCPDGHMSELMNEFMAEEKLTQLKYLVLNNIQETKARPIIWAIHESGISEKTFVVPGSKAYEALIKTSIGGLGASSRLGNSKGVFISEIKKAQAGRENEGGPTMIFLYDTVPPALTKMAGTVKHVNTVPGAGSHGVYAAAGNQALEADAARQERARKAAAALANQPHSTDEADGCSCLGCKCTLMKRDESSLQSTVFKRGDPGKQSRAVCPTCCKCKAE